MKKRENNLPLSAAMQFSTCIIVQQLLRLRQAKLSEHFFVKLLAGVRSECRA